MIETPMIHMSHASDSGQPSSQPSHLCQACLSVLARDDLELERPYAHHHDLKGFVEASQLRCYICSWLFTELHQRAQKGLGLLAEGRVPNDVIARKAQAVDDLVSDGREEFRNSIKSHWAKVMGRECNKSLSWVSFTGMKIEPHDISRNHLKISVHLNPLYEGYFPLPTKVYDSWLKGLWETLNQSVCEGVGKPLVVTHQDYLSLGLMTGPLPSNTASMGTWTTVVEWLQQCSEGHRCLSHIDPPWYPTRLVEVLSNDHFRIVRSDSKYFQSTGVYLTLSHRWGPSGDFVKLTTDNLSTLESGRSITILRKTFQDAIEIASRMAIPYLWIDSLCIIQSGDGGADWRQQSPTMAQVYSNSFCNISADYGDESNGLFFERMSCIEPPYELHMRWSPGLVKCWQMDNVPSLPADGGLCHIVRPRGWSEDVVRSPLNQRGWVLQERQLAPRVLHFSSAGVSWECRMKIAWERTPLGVSDDEFARSCGLLEYSIALSETRRLNLRDPDITVDWPRLVGEYTRCSLMNQSDRLVAIAGIAKTLASVAEDQYVVGIWSKTLPMALVWQTTSWRGTCNPTTSYFAPSFSWASAEGTVMYFSAGREILGSTSATFVQHRKQRLSSPIDKAVRAKLSGERLRNDVFGPITSPEVEVRMQAMLRSCRPVPYELAAANGFASTASYAFPSTNIEESAVSSCFEKGSVFQVDLDRFTEDAQLDSTTYYYTIISLHRSIHVEPSVSSYQNAEGILLKSVDSSMGRFKRIGHVTHSYPYDHNKPFKSILPLLGNERELPAWSYDETTGQHTFFIV